MASILLFVFSFAQDISTGKSSIYGIFNDENFYKYFAEIEIQGNIISIINITNVGVDKGENGIVNVVCVDNSNDDSSNWIIIIFSIPQKNPFPDLDVGNEFASFVYYNQRIYTSIIVSPSTFVLTSFKGYPNKIERVDEVLKYPVLNRGLIIDEFSDMLYTTSSGRDNINTLYIFNVSDPNKIGSPTKILLSKLCIDHNSNITDLSDVGGIEAVSNDTLLFFMTSLIPSKNVHLIHVNINKKICTDLDLGYDVWLYHSAYDHYNRLAYIGQEERFWSITHA